MATRRSHQKSRGGCTTCKKRHVKCDESGPPCGPCKVRATECEYSTKSGSTTSASASTEPLTEVDVSADWPVDEPAFPHDKRLRELQLMSRWSAITYKSMVTKIAADDLLWQIKVPELALQHDFLLCGVFALTGFEIASSCQRDRVRYLSAAHEYQATALSSYRYHLSHFGDDSIEATLMFSLMLMVLALASAQFVSSPGSKDHEDMVHKTIVHYELVRGCGVVLAGREEYLTQNPWVQKVQLFEDLPKGSMRPGEEQTIAKLNELNERRIMSSVSEPYEQRVQHMTNWKACKTAIEQLQDCIVKCDNPVYQGYVLAWLNFSGDEYIKAIKSGDEVALLTLMHWGVLGDKLAHLAWWARDFGRLVVEEISTKIQNANADDALMNQIIDLAQEALKENIDASETRQP